VGGVRAFCLQRQSAYACSDSAPKFVARVNYSNSFALHALIVVSEVKLPTEVKQNNVDNQLTWVNMAVHFCARLLKCKTGTRFKLRLKK
jgi:hypothetical protein